MLKKHCFDLGHFAILRFSHKLRANFYYLLFKKDEESYERRKEKCSRYNWRKLSSFRKSFYVNDGLTSEDSIERGGGYPNN